MRILGAPYDVVSGGARPTPRDARHAGPETPGTPSAGMDVARVSPSARVDAPVDISKVEQLKHELATDALSPNPTNIATIMLAEPSGDGR